MRKSYFSQEPITRAILSSFNQIIDSWRWQIIFLQGLLSYDIMTSWEIIYEDMRIYLFILLKWVMVYDKSYEGKRFWRLTYLMRTLVSPHYMRNQIRICEFFSFSLLTWVLVDEKSFKDKTFWHPRSTWESIIFSLRVWKISESSVHIMKNYDHSFFGSA
jgi:hypothetical protein